MITLGVRNMQVAINFYQQGLGFPRLDSLPGVAFINPHGTWLGLYGLEAFADDTQVTAAGSGFAGFSLSHNVMSEDEVDGAMA